MTTVTPLPRDAVETALARVISSRQFCNAPRLSRFLVYVVQESLANRLDRLKGYTIGLEVFDKPEDFDPQTDTIVRVQARALRQKLDQYYTQEGAQDAIHISIAKGSYEPAFFLTSDTGNHPSNGLQPPFAMSNKPSIAVLPFEDFSQEAEHQFFSHGLTEEVIADLSRFKELSVFSRSTTRKAKLDNLTIPQIYAAFRPDFVLEGSYRIAEQRVVITINLVVASIDQVILTQQFNRAMTPKAVHKVQDQMAQMIAERIADRFGPLHRYASRAMRTGNAQKWETYQLISMCHQHVFRSNDAVRGDLRDGLLNAVEIDPTSSNVHAALGLILLEDYKASCVTHPDSAVLDRALAHALKAVACDAENAAAQETVAVVRFQRREFDLFEAAAEQALALNPGYGDMLARLGICYGAIMKWTAAMPLLDKAIALNPLEPGWFHIAKAVGLAMQGNAKDAILEMNLAPMPGEFFYHCHMIWILVDGNEIAAAVQEKAKLLAALPECENVMLGILRIWNLDSAIIARVVAGWERVGLNVSEQKQS